MTPTASQVYSKTRILLGDDEVAGGDLYTNTYLLPHLEAAVNLLYKALERANSPVLRTKTYYLLSANRGYLTLDEITRHTTDLSAMISVRDMRHQASGQIAGLSFSSGGWVVSSTGHGLQTGDKVYVWGVIDGADEFINTDWIVTRIDADEFRLMGSPNKIAAVTPYTSGAIWLKGQGGWSEPYKQVESGQDIGDGMLSYRKSYDLREGALRLNPETEPRILEITYRRRPDNVVSTAPVIRIPRSLDFLSYMTGGLAAMAKGGTEAASTMLGMAVGVTNPADMDLGNPGGLLGDLVQEHAEASRGVVYTQRYRPQRYVRGVW